MICTERGCVFPALKHGLCLHHLRIWGGPPERVYPHPDTLQCACGKEVGHRGRCVGASQLNNPPKQVSPFSFQTHLR